MKLLLKVFASRGEFGSVELCPVGAYAVAFQLLVAPLCDRRCLLDDDVGLMGIRCVHIFICIIVVIIFQTVLYTLQ